MTLNRNYERLASLGVGFTGAHRTGKSTTAKYIADANEWPFVTSSAAAIAKRIGVDVTQMGFEERCLYQQEVLADALRQYEEISGPFVSDRTPLDFATYLMMDVPPVLTEERQAFILDYVDKCIEATNANFLTVTVLEPGIPYVAEEGKPVPNVAKQHQFNLILKGLMTRPDFLVHRADTPLDMVSLKERVMFAAENASNSYARYNSWRAQFPRN